MKSFVMESAGLTKLKRQDRRLNIELKRCGLSQHFPRFPCQAQTVDLGVT